MIIIVIFYTHFFIFLYTFLQRTLGRLFPEWLKVASAISICMVSVYHLISQSAFEKHVHLIMAQIMNPE